MATKTTKREKKFFGKFKEPLTTIPNLVTSQIESFDWLIKEGLKEVFQEFSSIKDFSEKKFTLDFAGFELAEPKYDEYYAKDNKLSYEAPLKVKVRLKNHIMKTEKEQEIFMADFPLMTPRGTLVINGVERVVVSQLIKSPGVFFTTEYLKGKDLYGAKIVPNRGAWLELDTDNAGVIGVKIDRKRRIPVTALLRIFGLKTNEQILEAFKDVDTNPEIKYIQNTLDKDASSNADEGYKEVYKRIRPGDLATVDNARSLIDAMFFNFDRYDISEVGRYKFNNV